MEKMFTLVEELDLLLQIITDVQAETETFLLILTGARVGYLTQSHGEIKHQNNQDNIHVQKQPNFVDFHKPVLRQHSIHRHNQSHCRIKPKKRAYHFILA